MRRSGIAFRFTLLTSVLILTTSATISLFVLWKYRVDESGERAERGITLARNLAYNSELGVLTRNTALLRELSAGIFQEGDVLDVSIRDASGEILFEKHRDGHSESDLIPLRDPALVDIGAGMARLTELARSPGGNTEMLEVAYPVFTRRGRRANEEIGFLLEEAEQTPGGRIEAIGEVRLTLDLAITNAEVASLQGGMGMLTSAVILFGVLLTIVIVRIVVRPVAGLVEATLRIASGNLDEVVEEPSTYELGALARAFNAMTGQLKKSRAELQSYSADLERQVRNRTRELEEAQGQLVQAEKMSAVGLLVSGVAHELNNPLAGVVGFSQLLLKEEAGEKVRRGLEKINREAERCKKIVQNLQTFARKHKPQKEHIGINGILESTLELRAYQLKVDDISVDLDLDPELPKTMADYHQLQQIFINILVNAHQAMVARGHGGHILIRTSASGGTIRVEIRDSGPGIPEEILPRIFDPFFTTKEVGQGTGLGLAICYGILEEHRGRISARNAPGGGAIFTVELPILAPEKPEPPREATGARRALAADAATRASGDEAVRGGNILVVDDELTIVDILYQVLKSDGHRVDTALSGKAALKKVERERYDVIISDLKMPGMSGQELWEKVRDLDGDLSRRIIFSTGDTVSTDTRTFLERSGNAYLQKPFEIDAIRDAVMAILKTGVVESAPPRA